MFKCKDCDSTEFNLVMQPNYKGDIVVQTNEHQEVEVLVNGQVFTADLKFVNQFAVCKTCSGIRCWEYYFPKHSATVSVQ